MKEKKNLITPEKAASFIPFFISSGVSILLIIFFVIPQYYKSNKVNLELNGLIKKKNQLENLKSQYKIINRKFDKLNKEKLKIIELITGTSNLETLLTQLGEIGSKNNIEFISIVPQKIIAPIENGDKKNIKKLDNQVNLINDPLLVEGIKKYVIDFTLKTEFVNFLSFLRELEFQDNVILLNDINLKLMNKDDDNGEIENSFEVLEITLRIIFYGKT